MLMRDQPVEVSCAHRRSYQMFKMAALTIAPQVHCVCNQSAITHRAVLACGMHAAFIVEN